MDAFEHDCGKTFDGGEALRGIHFEDQPGDVGIGNRVFDPVRPVGGLPDYEPDVSHKSVPNPALLLGNAVISVEFEAGNKHGCHLPEV